LVFTEEGRGICGEDDNFYMPGVQVRRLGCGRGVVVACRSCDWFGRAHCYSSQVQKAEEWGKLLALKSAVCCQSALFFKTGCWLLVLLPVLATGASRLDPDTVSSRPLTYCPAPHYDIIFVRSLASQDPTTGCFDSLESDIEDISTWSVPAA
jgi:hypothetical protein